VSARALRLLLVVSLSCTTIAAAPVRKTTAAACEACLGCTPESGRLKVARVMLFNQSRMNDDDIAKILAVANRIWLAYDVAVEADASPDAIKVIVSANAMRSGPPMAIGDTLFTKGHATPYIHLWLGAAEALAAGAEIDGRTFTSRSIDERNTILGHMLGVALAHELGHYLLDSRNHSTAGLLRETLSVSDMAFPKAPHLQLTHEQQRLMCLRSDTVLTERDRPAADPHRGN
jgi:hypothetical protein